MDFLKNSARWTFRPFGVASLAFLATSSMGGAYLYALQYKGNTHAVVHGEVYRSNQPDAARIAAMKKLYGIRTIINLRGPEPGIRWYDEEIAAARALGIQHVDFTMSASRPLTREQSRQLIALMRDAPKPLLIHCKSGSDRTGLAAALYVAAIAKGGEAQAEGQLSVVYGHFGFPLLPAYAMEQSFETMEEELGFHGS